MKQNSNKWWANDPLYNNQSIGMFASGNGIITSEEKYRLRHPWQDNISVFRESIDDQPFEYKDGTKRWYKHGRYHRDGKPAVIDNRGGEWFFTNGLLNRIDGPAIIKRSKIGKIVGIQWWINGQKLAGVNEWIVEMDMPSWDTWADPDKMLFKLMYGGCQS